MGKKIARACSPRSPHFASVTYLVPFHMVGSQTQPVSLNSLPRFSLESTAESLDNKSIPPTSLCSVQIGPQLVLWMSGYWVLSKKRSRQVDFTN